jgi:NADPH:quinone reductase-like Zn-dependent oxidoreductase
MQLDERPMPVVGPGQLLIAVKAAGVDGTDWKIRQGLLRDLRPLTFPAVLGAELAGCVIEAHGSRFRVGDRVMGPVGLGAYADYVAVDENTLCHVPDGLTDVQAVAVPVAALTAWQALRVAGELRPWTKVPVHGAAGGVGGFAFQFAKAASAIVLATAAASSRAHVQEFGADEVIDYRANRFKEHATDIGLVLDLVGGETLDRSWSVLSDRGALVSIVAAGDSNRAPAGRRGVWFSMHPDPVRLTQITRDVASGRLVSIVADAVAFAELPTAIERSRTGHPPGKIVADFLS